MSDYDNGYVKKVKIGEANVVNGEADVPIQVDSGVLNGEYVLYADYSGTDNYAPSSANGILRIGYQSLVHMPRVYVWAHLRSATPFVAHVYMGIYQAGQGTGYFYIDGAQLDAGSPSHVAGGKAKKTVDTSNLDITTYNDSHKAFFKYLGYTNDLSRMINPGRSNEADIVYLSEKTNPDLFDENTDRDRGYCCIEMEPVAGKAGETVTTQAHIYLLNDEDEVQNDKDVANHVTGVLYYGYGGNPDDSVNMTENNFYRADPIDDNGYATISFVLPEWKDGGYDLYAHFVHADGQKWASTYGCTSMFITSNIPKVNEPLLTIQDISFNKGTQFAYITGQFTAPYGDDVTSEAVLLEGYASLLIDSVVVDLTNSNVSGNTIPVSPNGYVEFQFSIEYYDPDSSPEWVKPGKHKITVLYHQNSTDMDYEYNPDARLIIRRETSITIDNIDDNDGLIYMPNNGESTAVRCTVYDQDDGTIINEGSVLVSYEKTDVQGV